MSPFRDRVYVAKFRAAVLTQVKARYEDFGPTLASLAFVRFVAALTPPSQHPKIAIQS